MFKSRLRIDLIVMVILTILLVACGCRIPRTQVQIENLSTQTLTIYLQYESLGIAAPGEIVSGELYWDIDSFHVSAQNDKDELVYLQNIARNDCEWLDNRTIKTIIPADIPYNGPRKVEIVVENPTCFRTHIIIDGIEYGEISPGDNLSFEVPVRSGRYQIHAEDSYGYNFFRDYCFIESIGNIAETDEKTMRSVIRGPYQLISIRNDTQKTLLLYLNLKEFTTLRSGSTTTQTIEWDGLDYIHIYAQDEKGNLVFEKRLMYQVSDKPSAENISAMEWEINIPVDNECFPNETGH